MSLGIAIKDKNKIHYGVDMQANYGDYKDKTDCKMFVPKGCKETVLLCSGTLRAAQILKASDNLIDESKFCFDYIATDFIKNVCSALKENQVEIDILKENYLPLDFILINKNNAFRVDSFGYITDIETNGFLTIGSGDETARAVLLTLKETGNFEDTENAMKTAFDICRKMHTSIGMGTKICSYEKEQ